MKDKRLTIKTSVINDNNAEFSNDIVNALEISKSYNVIPSTTFTDTELQDSLNKLYTLAIKPVTPLDKLATQEARVPLRFHSEPISRTPTLNLPSVPK